MQTRILLVHEQKAFDLQRNALSYRLFSLTPFFLILL